MREIFVSEAANPTYGFRPPSHPFLVTVEPGIPDVRSAEERTARIADPLAQYDELAARREKKKKGEGKKTRTSTTDPDARNMKMANERTFTTTRQHERR